MVGDDTAQAKQPEVAPNKVAFAVTLLVVLVVGFGLFWLLGLQTLPPGTPQEAAGYYGVRLIPFGVALTVLGFAVALATSVGTAFGVRLRAPAARAAPAGLTLGAVTDLVKAAGSLASTPAGIGVLLTVLGTALLIGSGLAAGGAAGG